MKSCLEVGVKNAKGQCPSHGNAWDNLSWESRHSAELRNGLVTKTLQAPTCGPFHAKNARDLVETHTHTPWKSSAEVEWIMQQNSRKALPSKHATAAD